MSISSTISSLNSNPAISAAVSSVSGSNDYSAPDYATERLFTSRPRYANNSSIDRGQWGYIRLLGYDGQGSATEGVSEVYQQSLNLLTQGEEAGAGYDKFLITNISSSMDEKVQVTEVFGDTEVAYYFGRSPMMFNVSGLLFDSRDNSWFTDWIHTYNDILRGSKLAQKREQVQLVLPSMTVNGAITNFAWSQDSQNDVAIKFQFTMLITRLVPTPPVALDYQLSNDANLIDFRGVEQFQNKAQSNQIKNAVLTLQKGDASTAEKAAAMKILSAAPNSTTTLPTSTTSDGGLFPSAASAINGVASSINGVTSSITQQLNNYLGPNSFLGGISSSLSALRASLFLPVYGVMNSLTKLVGAVFGSGGIASLLTNLTAPIRNILGDITRFANQATAIANTIVAGFGTLGRGFKTGFGITTAYTQAALAMSKASGTFASLPGNVGSSVQGLFSGGFIPTKAAFLKLNPKATLSRTPSLSFGPHLSLAASPQLSILSKGVTSTKGAYI